VVAAFRRGLREAGFVEGQNLVIEFRWAEGRYDRLPALADDLVGRKVAVLIAVGGPASAFAAKAATSTIPIVFITSDPVQLGLVDNLNRPGGNITGVSLFSQTIWAKRLDLLKQLVPTATVIALLVNPSNPDAGIYSKEAVTAGSALGIRIPLLKASSEHDLGEAFASLAKLGAGGLVVPADAFFDTQRERIVELSARYSVIGSYPWREFAVAGGLMSYGTSLPDSYRQAGNYGGRILKGEKPADLPIVQPTKFELVINLATAKTLGLTVPSSLLAFADEVIE
jgi:putative ABC transport system substrate-binding protein